MIELSDFDRLLKQTMGLDVTSIGASALERAVQERLRACGIDDTRTYLERVRSSEPELQSLIEAVIIPETWFFRDREVFRALVRYVNEEWLPAHTGGVLRLLSLPCSTGEEPYSIAMALLDAKLPAKMFRVDAIDICGRSLALARRAVYGKGSFRGDDLSFRERYFERTASGHALNEAVRRQVSFHQGNLLSPGFLPGLHTHDVIFCRNMLIYFDGETQRRAVGVLERLLAPTGLLFVGSSESGVFLDHAFTSAKMPMAFAFRKGRATTPPKRSAPAAKPKRHATFRPMAKSAAATQPLNRPAADPPTTPSSTGLEESLQLADRGLFAEASKSCEDHIRRHGPSAEAFHVLGLLRDASGNINDAAACYKKALYLDPHHADALVHLALLMEKQGQKSEAQMLWNRARRVATPKAL